MMNSNNSDLILKINQLLNENGIATTFDDNNIYALEDYKKSLRKGIELFEENGLQDEVAWVNPYDEERQIGYLSILCGKLPKDRRGKSIWSYCDFDKTPIDMKEFMSFLRGIVIPNVPDCDTREMDLIFHEKENAFEILVPGKIQEFDKIQECMKEKVETYQNKYPHNFPFEKIYWTNYDGSWDRPNLKDETHSKMYSYLSHSWFLKALFDPENRDVESCNKMGLMDGFQSHYVPYQTRNFEVHTALLQPGVREGFEGTFTVTSSKIFDQYKDIDEKMQSLTSPEMFTMIDNGKFKSYVSYDEENNQVNVRTIIDLIRSTVGYDYDKKGLRDAIFRDVPQSDYWGQVEVNEYFKVLDSNQLIHLIDGCPYCEIYHLPESWHPLDGIDIAKQDEYISVTQFEQNLRSNDSSLSSDKNPVKVKNQKC